jgi:hypothetical protein
MRSWRKDDRSGNQIFRTGSADPDHLGGPGSPTAGGGDAAIAMFGGGYGDGSTAHHSDNRNDSQHEDHASLRELGGRVKFVYRFSIQTAMRGARRSPAGAQGAL